MLNLGSTTMRKLMLGSTEIRRAYLGATKVYEADPDAAISAILAGGLNFALDTGRMADFWQNSTKTTPVTASGQVIGNGQTRFGTTVFNYFNATAGNLPTWDSDGWMLFDGTNDLLASTDVAPILNAATAAHFTCAVWVNTMPASVAVLATFSTATTTTSRFTPQINANGSVSLNVRRLDADANAVATSAAGLVSANNYYIISGDFTPSTGAIRLWVNGTLVATGTSASTGAAFSATNSARCRIGCSVNTNQFFNGLMRRLVVATKILSDADRATVETWAAGIRTYSAGSIIASGARTWFNSPSGAAIGSKIYVPQVNDGVEITLTEWDHANNKARVVAKAASGTVSNGDDHNEGGVIKLANGNLLWMPVDHSDPNIRAIYGLPGSFTEVDLSTALGQTVYAYTQIVQLDSGTIHDFTRINTANNWMATSADGGATWTTLAQQFTNGTGDRPYPQYCKGGASRIDVLITDGHPDELAFNSSIFHAYFDGSVWRKTDGTSLGSTPVDVSTLTKVFDGVANAKSWTWDLKLMGADLVGLFASFPTADAHRYHRCVLSGGAWSVETIYNDAGYSLYGPAPTSQPSYSGGMALHPTNKDVVYACISKAAVRSGKHQLYRLDRVSAGVWSETQLTDTDDEWFRPDTSGGQLTVCYGPYVSYTTFNGCRMLGVKI